MRTKRTCVILISGKAYAGKTTVGDKLIQKLKDLFMDVMDYGFADPLKYIAKAYFGWDEKKDEKGRKLLQNIGRIGREYDVDIWVKHFLNQLDKQSGIFPKNFVVIDDWRYPNEMTYLKDNPLLDVVTIRLFGRGGLEGELASDISETSLVEIYADAIPNTLEGDHWYDFQIDNSGHLDSLDIKLDLVLAEIAKQYIVE